MEARCTGFLEAERTSPRLRLRELETFCAVMDGSLDFSFSGLIRADSSVNYRCSLCATKVIPPESARRRDFSTDHRPGNARQQVHERFHGKQTDFVKILARR